MLQLRLNPSSGHGDAKSTFSEGKGFSMTTYRDRTQQQQQQQQQQLSNHSSELGYANESFLGNDLPQRRLVK
jgi:hypothetical protein